MIDLRSDTVTVPTAPMRTAMMQAEVGDDVWGEDPTVRVLEGKLAGLFGHEAGLFCPSGTMTNQIAIRTHTRPGDDVVCSTESHIYNYEGGGIAANAGASVRLLTGDRGRFTLEDVKAGLQPDDPHYPRTRLVAIEDTSNRGGGAIWKWDDLVAISTFCRQEGLRMHLDGARVFNRLVATGDDIETYGRLYDSISVCLSKGLGGPAGSVLLGSQAFIHQARRVRKMMGGGMRQVGFLAAAGLYALEHNVDRLADDHRHARIISEALESSDNLESVVPVETNIILFRPAADVGVERTLDHLRNHGISAAGMGPGVIRFVTHLHIDAPAVDAVVSALEVF